MTSTMTDPGAMTTISAPARAADGAHRGALLVDTHCHLDAEQFMGESTTAVLARAIEVGVRRVVTIGTDLDASRRAVDVAASHPEVWAAVGVDPNDAAGFDGASLGRLTELARCPKVVAIGEIGLDYYWNRAPAELQQRAFGAQLRLARELGLPVVIHCRDAFADTAAMLRRWAADCRRDGARDGRPVGIMHCYSGDLPLARDLAEVGFLISLAGPLTFKNARSAREVAAGLPEGALVLETDAPYLAPHPYRGQRNEPARVRDIAVCLAELRGTTLASIARVTSANAARVFGWEAPETWEVG